MKDTEIVGFTEVTVEKLAEANAEEVFEHYLPIKTTSYLRPLYQKDLDIVFEYDRKIPSSYAIGSFGLFAADGSLMDMNIDLDTLIREALKEKKIVYFAH